MPMIDEWKDVPAGQRPTFHEIRHLLVKKGKDGGQLLDDMGKHLGQKDKKSITSYDTHDAYEEHTINQPLWNRA